MLTPLPCALQATQARVPHAELALSLAAAFHEVHAERADGESSQVAKLRLERVRSRLN